MIRQTLRSGVIVAGLACMVGGCGPEQPAANAGDVQRAAPGTGVTASDFTARDIDGKTVRLSTYLGKQAILLNFWQSWCEPCVAEFPHLRRMYEANKDKGFIIFGVAMDGPETVANVPAFAKRNQLNFTVLLDEDSQIAALYNPKKSAPLSVLIDKTGKIAVIREGYNPGDEEYLAKEVEKVLATPAAPPAPAPAPSPPPAAASSSSPAPSAATGAIASPAP